MRVADGVVRRLIGDKLTVEYADGRTTERVVPAAELPDVLASLDVVLSDEEVDRLRLV
jgi:N-hydroxyarylamine O-acetyltransferase